jgi:HSP20 family protein
MALTKVPDTATIPRNWPNFTWPTLKWFDEMFRDLDGHQMMKIEEVTEGDEFVVRAELPDIDPNTDLDVEVTDGVLTISATRTEKKEQKDRHVRRSEFRYGSFVRSLPVPKGVDEATITATYAEGVLEVRVPASGETTKSSSHKVKVTKR